MAKFEKLRVSLQREEPGSLLNVAAHEETHRSRSEFLAAAFAEERSFLRGDTVLSFTPIEAPDGYVAGFFKRLRPAVLAKRDLTHYQAEHYESSLVIVSLGSEQFAWVQVNSRIGSTRVILEAYLNHLVSRTDVNDWRPYVRFIEVEQEYWDVIRTKKQDIASISFTFVPPNALGFGPDERIYQLVKDIHNEGHPDIQQHVYKASPGQMDPESPLMKGSARISMDGGGETEVRDGNGRRIYSSGQARVSEQVPADEMPTPEKPAFVRRVIRRLFGI